MTTRTVDATQELAAFLRTRRERLDPDDVGLPSRRRSRRTPGLRREEVAELAGVSVDYVVRLEQGRGLRPSVGVLEALSRALRLAPDERTYVFDLARQRRPDDADGPATTAVPTLARLVTDLSPLPAMVLNHRYDILSWNREMAELLVDFGTLPPSQRNSMWMCLMHPRTREFYVDRERVVREGWPICAPRGPRIPRTGAWPTSSSNSVRTTSSSRACGPSGTSRSRAAGAR